MGFVNGGRVLSVKQPARAWTVSMEGGRPLGSLRGGPPHVGVAPLRQMRADTVFFGTKAEVLLADGALRTCLDLF